MARLEGKTVQSVDYHRDARLNTNHEELRNSLCNTSIASVERSGKEIAFFFPNKATLFVHLMLSGRFIITSDPDSVRFRVLTIGFEGSLSLVVSDPKRLSDSQDEPYPEQRP
jgi:formamidopyrimidine-DNA glycosylase